MRKIIAIAAAVSMLGGGCASSNGGYGSSWEPVVDIRPDQQTRYALDLQECQQHANRVMGAGQGAAVGAIAGAIFGALLGAAAGGDSRFNSQMAGVGAVSGGAGAAASAEGGQRGIISRCMAGRGYSVLN